MTQALKHALREMTAQMLPYLGGAGGGLLPSPYITHYANGAVCMRVSVTALRDCKAFFKAQIQHTLKKNGNSEPECRARTTQYLVLK